MRSKIMFWLTLLLLVLIPSFASAANPGSIHGHVQDPLGIPMANVQVIVSLNGVTADYTFVTDKNGDYTGTGITPRTYTVMLSNGPKTMLDRVLNVNIAPGADTKVDFDLSRPDYIAKLPPDQQAQIEERKKKNATITKENQDLPKLNSMLKEARQDNAQKQFDQAAGIMQQAVQMEADAPVLWLELGVSQLGQKKYDDATTSLKKALDLDAKSEKPNPEIAGPANNSLGEAYIGLNKIPEAVAAYDAAVKAQPQQAAFYYRNEAIALSKKTDVDTTTETVAAADKAIAANPKDALPYYLKGTALISKATVDPKTNKITAPPGAVDAYDKYLELAPNGQFAEDVKQILAQVGEKVKSSYSAGKK